MMAMPSSSTAMLNVSRNWPSAIIGRIVGADEPPLVGAKPASPVGAKVLSLVGANGLSLVVAVDHRLGNTDVYACGSGSVEGCGVSPRGASSCSSGAGPRPSASPSV